MRIDAEVEEGTENIVLEGTKAALLDGARWEGLKIIKSRNCNASVFFSDHFLSSLSFVDFTTFEFDWERWWSFCACRSFQAYFVDIC